MPGKRDVVTVRAEQGKQKFQKWHLYMSLRETHNTFIKENPKMNIGLTKFGMLCPSHVKFSSQTHANVCTCVYHQNIILALVGMNGYSDSFPIYCSSFPNSYLAEPENEKCWFGHCNHINCGFQYHYPKPHNMEQQASWKIWEDNNGRIVKNTKTGQIEDMYQYLCNIVPPFLTHCFIKRKQAESYEKDKAYSLSEQSDTFMLQVDFVENYTCLAQDEVQSAHWKQSQITLFTCVTWF